ncbi:hypothetical protein IMY05_C4481000300 [Salix suchowensis]|nr:hypothetical protein IMY05_C4481000300 [Salix suchowensis]
MRRRQGNLRRMRRTSKDERRWGLYSGGDDGGEDVEHGAREGGQSVSDPQGQARPRTQTLGDYAGGDLDAPRRVIRIPETEGRTQHASILEIINMQNENLKVQQASATALLASTESLRQIQVQNTETLKALMESLTNAMANISTSLTLGLGGVGQNLTEMNKNIVTGFQAMSSSIEALSDNIKSM